MVPEQYAEQFHPSQPSSKMMLIRLYLFGQEPQSSRQSFLIWDIAGHCAVGFTKQTMEKLKEK